MNRGVQPALAHESRKTWSVILPGSGTGVVSVEHPLKSSNVQVSVQRILLLTPTALPLIEVQVATRVADDSRVILDFDTYSRAVGEFKVTVQA